MKKECFVHLLNAWDEAENAQLYYEDGQACLDDASEELLSRYASYEDLQQ